MLRMISETGTTMAAVLLLSDAAAGGCVDVSTTDMGRGPAKTIASMSVTWPTTKKVSQNKFNYFS